MPYEIKWEENGVVAQFSGIFDYEVNKAANCDVWEDPRCDNIKYAIWDATGISELVIPLDNFYVLAMQDHAGSPRLPALKLAMVAKDRQIRRYFEKYTANFYNQKTNWHFMVSASIEKVRSWIAS